MIDESLNDYSDRAVKEPAKKALANGDKAVASGNKAVKSKKSTATNKKKPIKIVSPPTNLTVNPASKLSINEFITHLKNSILPKKIRQSIKRNNDKIQLPGVIPKGVKSSQWLQDLLSIGEDWELSTGEFQLVLKKDLKSFWGTRLYPDLDKEATYGFLMEPPTTDEPNPILMPNSTRCWIKRGTPTGSIIGLTTPKYEMVRNIAITGEAGTRLVVLDSGRGLVCIANRAKFYMLERERSCWNIEQLNTFTGREKFQPTISRWLIRNALIHELSAHAGLFSQNLPAEHTSNPDSRVESNVRSINNLDTKFSKENDKLFKSVEKEFNFLKKAEISP